MKIGEKIQTVTGMINAEEAGITLSYEHLFADMRAFFVEPDKKFSDLKNQPVSLKNLVWIRSNRMSNLENLKPFKEEDAINEVLLFKEAGGKTIVEQTPINLGLNPEKLLRVSMRSGVNIIMGTGYYRENILERESRNNSKITLKSIESYPNKYITVDNKKVLNFVQITILVPDKGFNEQSGRYNACTYPYRIKMHDRSGNTSK